ncbi:MAG TPA: cytochrome c oxidase assembly protein [Methylomirabilota bacterium]|jgi:putative membrane protein
MASRLPARFPPALGTLIAVAAVAPPMHAAADASVAAHMVQHLVLILAAAPLLVLGHPVRLLPASVVRPLARLIPLTRHRLRVLAVVAWLSHVVVLWAWHTPRLYEWALASAAAHALEHVSLVVTACAFWAAALSRRVLGAGGAVVYLFAAAGQGTALGALLTLAESPWYPSPAATVAGLGLTALEDQQLAGLIMWIPGGMSYAAVALALLARTLRDDGPTALYDRSTS